MATFGVDAQQRRAEHFHDQGVPVADGSEAEDLGNEARLAQGSVEAILEEELHLLGILFLQLHANLFACFVVSAHVEGAKGATGDVLVDGVVIVVEQLTHQRLGFSRHLDLGFTSSESKFAEVDKAQMRARIRFDSFSASKVNVVNFPIKFEF